MYSIRYITDNGQYFDLRERGRTEWRLKTAERIAERIHTEKGFTCYIIPQGADA